MAGAEVVFHPDAAAEYTAALLWYAERSASIAERFEKEVDRAVERIAEAPGRWAVYDETHRKLLVPGFPYLLIYRMHRARVWIVAVAHGHRRPGYWKHRTIDT